MKTCPFFSWRRSPGPPPATPKTSPRRRATRSRGLSTADAQAARRHHQRRARHARQAESPAWKALQAKDLAPLRTRPARHPRDERHVSGDLRFPRARPFAAGAKPARPINPGARKKSTSTATSRSSSASCTSSRCASCRPTAKSASRWSPSTGGRTGLTSRRRSWNTRAATAGSAAPCRRPRQVAPGRRRCTKWTNRRATRVRPLAAQRSFSTWISGDTWRPAIRTRRSRRTLPR